MKRIKILLMLFVLFFINSGCSVSNENDILDASKPVTVTLWHYYNGQIKENFDSLVSQFNETVGMEKGIVVDALSQGDVQQLADAVFNAANKSIGSSSMPDIFAAYPENAYRVNQVSELVLIEDYFSKEELEKFRAEFLQEGRFGTDEKLRILPVAKSTENLYVNKTYWEVFASQYALTDDDLSTWESIYETSKLYYESTGKAFFSIDANANFILQASMQLGDEIYRYSGDGVELYFPKENAKKIWDYYYVPYIKGYYLKTGRFSSDDAKTGTILSYTGSTAGAAYFPKNVTFGQNEVYPIEPLILPYPYFQGGEKYAIQQGAGMCITKTDKEHEYASAVFLKWFTEIDQNVEFSVSTNYLPVKNEALNKDMMLDAIQDSNSEITSIKESILTTNKMLEDYTFYNNKSFERSYEMRSFFETNLSNIIKKNLENLNIRMEKGEKKPDVINELISEESFENWYIQFIQEANKILNN